MYKHYTLTIQPQDDTLTDYNVCGFWQSASAAIAYVAPKVAHDAVTDCQQTNRCH